MLRTLARQLPFTPYPYRGEKVACNLCGSTEVEVICEYDRRFKRLRTIACIGCGLLRTDPMPTAAEVARYYEGAYRQDYQVGFGSRKPSRRQLNRSRNEAMQRLTHLAPALTPAARILDFGSGTGEFLGTASAAGYIVRGIEPGRDSANYTREAFGVDVISDVWEQIDQPLGPFDVITAVEVLEHLREPVRALRWLASLLADNGIIYVTVPNGAPTTRETFRLFHFAHLFNFTPKTLLWAGEVSGLELDRRFTPLGTRMVFRKATATRDPATIRGREGAGLSAQYPNNSIAWYVLSGGWFAGRLRQLLKTTRDTFGRRP